MRKALSLSGQDPDRFWFATFNKLEEEQIFSPKTILLNQPIARMAEAAVDLISRLQTGAPPEHLYFSSDLLLPTDR
jgi:DNA-binding LacI/PurR family transcriptional regulator